MFLLMAFSTGSAFSNVELGVESKSRLLTVVVKSNISDQDYAEIIDAANSMQAVNGDNWRVHAVLRSRGGSVSAALNIGRFLRRKEADGFVAKEVCFSSCVYILAGATQRHVVGPVGIHRAYEPEDQKISAAAQKTKYAILAKQITQQRKLALLV